MSFVFGLSVFYLSPLSPLFLSTEQGRSGRCAQGPGAAAWPGSPSGGGRA